MTFLFNDIDFNQKFDYITLIGVLEYAPGFTSGGNPVDFLKRIRINNVVYK